MTTAQAEKLKKLEAAYERAYKHGGEVALYNAQIALERFEVALERSEKLKAAGLRSRSNPRRWKIVRPSDVGKYLPGNKWKDFPIQARDVGKKYYIEDGMVFIENDEQMRKRAGKTNPYEYRARVKGNTRRRVNAASSTGKMIPAKVMVGKGGKVRVFVNPRYLSNPTGWTIAKIKAANKAKGYHFFDASTMKFFNSKVLPNVYQGSGGVYFITSEYMDEPTQRKYKVRRFAPESANISTVSTAHNLRQAEGDARSMAG